MLALALVAFLVGAIVGSQHGGSAASKLADRFVTAWTHSEYLDMYADIDPASRRESSAGEFADAYQQAMRTATATRMKVTGRPRVSGGTVTVPVRVVTRLFGTLSLDFAVPVAEAGEAGLRVHWSRSLTFPGLRSGEQLSRRTSLPRRATLLARDGSVLAESPAGLTATEGTRSSPLGEAARAVIGTVGPVPSARRAVLEAEGVPANAIVGLSGLERALDDRLRGRPGGELLAGQRLLAYTAPRAAPAVNTTVSPTVQRAAVSALGGQLGGIVALQPSTGQILAVAGIGLEGLQPPGSTFKMITLTGVLQAHIANRHTVFPYATSATLDGVKLSNADGEECGGSLELAFAVSCNSVFTPLGVKLGAKRLVATAEAFGFNHETGVPGAAESTLPPAGEIQGELDVGSTAIGQGQVLATPLQMALVAATVADGGRRPQPSFLPASSSSPNPHVMSSSIARTVRHLMIEVVNEGTGKLAAIPGATVAGKTGTAELKSACKAPAESSTGEEAKETSKEEGCSSSESEGKNTDAWFAAFAPAFDPRIVVCALMVEDGAGGSTAAPVARQVLEAGLRR
ncbi:MAG TPA: penicillin-binding transpeptidase domain-containing protein [Solirubrobacteraceae bacterium]|nr:penicillin-binding transpeptidase domain-containing protein [Solirubrobacteraceae bacterium]